MFINVKRCFEKNKQIIKIGVASLLLGLYTPNVFAGLADDLFEPLMDFIREGFIFFYYIVYVAIVSAAMGAIIQLLRRRLDFKYAAIVVICAVLFVSADVLLDGLGYGGDPGQFANEQVNKIF